MIELIYQIRVRLVLAREQSERECKLINNTWFLIRLVLMQRHLIKGSLLEARGAAVGGALSQEWVLRRSRVVGKGFTTTAPLLGLFGSLVAW